MQENNVNENENVVEDFDPVKEINELKKHKEYYFEHFNPDIGDELV